MQGENWDEDWSEEWQSERPNQEWQNCIEIKQEVSHYLNSIKLKKLDYEQKVGLVIELLD